MEKSFLDYAFDFVSKSKKPVTFKEIWAYVVEKAGLSEEEASERVSRFFTNLMLDGRFVTLGENTWDLRERQTFDKVHIDMKDVYADDDVSDDDKEESDEEKEYNAAFEDKSDSDDEDIEEESESEDGESKEDLGL